MNWHEYAGVNYLSYQEEDADSAVILFHGYGADATDLVPLASELMLGAGHDYYFPQGVLEVPIGPMMTGRGWFSLENRDWDALMSGQIDDSAFTPAVHHTLQQAQELVQHLAKDYKNVYVGGFSQGAILTSHTFYRLNFVPKGLLLLSGYLVSPSEFPTIPAELKVPFFQSHGRQDAVLPIAGARQLFEKLKSFGLAGKFIEFNGGHEIPRQVVEGMAKFMRDQL